MLREATADTRSPLETKNFAKSCACWAVETMSGQNP